MFSTHWASQDFCRQHCLLYSLSTGISLDAVVPTHTCGRLWIPVLLKTVSSVSSPAEGQSLCGETLTTRMQQILLTEQGHLIQDQNWNLTFKSSVLNNPDFFFHCCCCCLFLWWIFISGKWVKEFVKSKKWVLRTRTNSLTIHLWEWCVCWPTWSRATCQQTGVSAETADPLGVYCCEHWFRHTYSGSYLLACCQIHFQAQCFTLPAWVIYAVAHLDKPALLAVGEMHAVVLGRMQTTPLYCSA